jgi:ABC-type antimicrobial peptide transport system permease subunit
MRRKEMAVRLALGASRFRLVRQLLTESVLLGLLGAGGGLLLAFWINRGLMALKPPLPESYGLRLDFRLDATVLGFSLLLALLVTLLFGLAPALATTKPEVVPALKDETGSESGRGRFLRINLRKVLVSVQLAVSLVLLIVAGLFTRSLQQLQKVDPGFLVHTAGNPKSLVAAVRHEVQALDEDLPAQEIKTLDEFVGISYWPMRTGAGLVGTFGLLGLLLASIGMYGVMSYAVAARTREIGVRMALGAKRRDILKLIVGQGLALVLVGGGAGILLAFAVTRVLQRFLFGIGAVDPPTFILVTLLLTMVALLACWIPARRATKVDPLTALRHE